MNIEHLRKSLKVQWLTYYRDNRDWISRLGVWVECEGQRRPSSSFILATLATLEPQFHQLLPFIVDLSSNPDRIVIALGLNSNPDEQLEALTRAEEPGEIVKMLPSSAKVMNPASNLASNLTGQTVSNHKRVNDDQACQGSRDTPPLNIR